MTPYRVSVLRGVKPASASLAYTLADVYERATLYLGSAGVLALLRLQKSRVTCRESFNYMSPDLKHDANPRKTESAYY